MTDTEIHLPRKNASNFFLWEKLISHPAVSTILPEDIKIAITNNHPLLRILLAEFGTSKTINAGILCGSFQQESWQPLTNALETALWDQLAAIDKCLRNCSMGPAGSWVYLYSHCSEMGYHVFQWGASHFNWGYIYQMQNWRWRFSYYKTIKPLWFQSGRPWPVPSMCKICFNGSTQEFRASDSADYCLAAPISQVNPYG